MPGGACPLIVSASGGFVEIAELLIKSKADVDQKDDRGATVHVCIYTLAHRNDIWSVCTCSNSYASECSKSIS
jgi:hypothetical protein